MGALVLLFEPEELDEDDPEEVGVDFELELELPPPNASLKNPPAFLPLPL